MSVLPHFGPVGDAMRSIVDSQTPAIGPLQADYEYLQIEVNGRRILVALGSRHTSLTAQGNVTDEYWYSGSREMLHLRNGRLHTAWGLNTEWRDNRSSPPSWASLSSTDHAIAWVRTRDEMPHYRYGIQDRITSQRLKSAPPSAPAALSTTPSAVTWFQDHISTTTATGQSWVYPQHFALLDQQLVYSEQCIAPHLCLKLTRLR